MDTLFWLKTYAVAASLFFAIDLFWLGVVARSFYRDRLGHLMADRVKWPPALVFYLFFVAGLLYFVVEPALVSQQLSVAFGRGLLLGLLTYATYDFTNWATLRNWPISIVVVDVLWGGWLCALVSGATFWVASHWF